MIFQLSILSPRLRWRPQAVPALPVRPSALTGRDARAGGLGDSALDPEPDRRPSDLGAGRAAHKSRADVGLVDHRADARRPRSARAADRTADPFDAADAAAPAGDEGDPEALQGRSQEAERRADEVLPGEPDQPGLLVSSDPAADPDLLRALLRAEELRRRHLSEVPRVSARLAQLRSRHHREHR